MAITRASQDASATPYITAEECRMLLQGNAADEAGNFFGAFWDRNTVKQKVAFLLKVSKEEVDRKSKTNFELHEDVEVAFDGNGEHIINAADYGFAPLIDVTTLSICGYDIDVDSFEWYETGEIKLNAVVVDYLPQGIQETLLSARFQRGAKNVLATLSWGWATAPYKIKLASAFEVGAALLDSTPEVSDQRDPAIPDGATVSYGDMKVVKPSRMATAERWRKRSTELCRGWRSPLIGMPTPSATNDFQTAVLA